MKDSRSFGQQMEDVRIAWNAFLDACLAAAVEELQTLRAWLRKSL